MKDYGLIIILLFPLLGSGIGYYIGLYNERKRNLFSVLLTGINLAIISTFFPWVLHQPMEVHVNNIMGTGLYLKLDMFRYVFVWVTALIWFLTTMYTSQYLIKYSKRNRYYAFFMLTYASTLGIFISDHMLNLFTFFEIMSLASYALVIHDEDEYSHEAGISYVSMALAGGLVLLTGLILLYDYTGTLLISDFARGSGLEYIGNVRYLISILIIVGFGVKASMIPLHSWLPKAHPAAPTPASAVLSGILVKTGVFGIMITVLVLMKGDKYLSMFMVCIGCVNILHGGLLAVMQRNIKRILAYSSMSQLGYIFIGIGLVGLLEGHGGLALVGTLYHIFNHAIFKVLLFMGVGIIYMVVHELSINKIGGFGRGKVMLRTVFFVGCLAIIGMPGTNGFISKTLLHEAIVEAIHMYDNVFFRVVEYIFIIGAGLTVAYLMKIFVAVFVEPSKNVDLYDSLSNRVRKRALFPMVILGVMIILIGIMPDILFKYMEHIPEAFGLEAAHAPAFFTLTTITGFIIPFILGLAIYFGYVRKVLRREVEGKSVYINPTLLWIDLERDVYRPLTKFIFSFSSSILRVADRGVIDFFTGIRKALFHILRIEFKYNSFDIADASADLINNTAGLVNKGTDKTKDLSSGILSWGNNKIEDVKSKSQNQSKTMRELFMLTGTNLSSLVYTVVTFIFVLVVILVLMMK